MSNVNTTNRTSFFPKEKNSHKTKNLNNINSDLLKRNNEDRQKKLDNLSARDARVNISDATKDFARIKRVADSAPEIDNSLKIADLKAKIASGKYKVDPEAIAQKMLESEF